MDHSGSSTRMPNGWEGDVRTRRPGMLHSPPSLSPSLSLDYFAVLHWVPPREILSPPPPCSHAHKSTTTGKMPEHAAQD